MDMRENKKTLKKQEIRLEFKRNLIGEATFALTTFSTVGHTRELLRNDDRHDVTKKKARIRHC